MEGAGGAPPGGERGGTVVRAAVLRAFVEGAIVVCAVWGAPGCAVGSPVFSAAGPAGECAGECAEVVFTAKVLPGERPLREGSSAKRLRSFISVEYFIPCPSPLLQAFALEVFTGCLQNTEEKNIFLSL